MKTEERRVLYQRMCKLPSSSLSRVMEILSLGNPIDNTTENIQINLESLVCVFNQDVVVLHMHAEMVINSIGMHDHKIHWHSKVLDLCDFMFTFGYSGRTQAHFGGCISLWRWLQNLPMKKLQANLMVVKTMLLVEALWCRILVQMSVMGITGTRLLLNERLHLK